MSSSGYKSVKEIYKYYSLSDISVQNQWAQRGLMNMDTLETHELHTHIMEMQNEVIFFRRFQDRLNITIYLKA